MGTRDPSRALGLLEEVSGFSVLVKELYFSYHNRDLYQKFWSYIMLTEFELLYP